MMIGVDADARPSKGKTRFLACARPCFHVLSFASSCLRLAVAAFSQKSHAAECEMDCMVSHVSGMVTSSIP